MKTLNKIILTSLIGIGSFNNLYSQEDNLKEIESMFKEVEEIFKSDFNERKKREEAHYQALEKYTPITKESYEGNLFLLLNSGLKEYLEKIYFIDEKDFFYKDTGGHTHLGKGVICLSNNSIPYYNNALFHEAGHVRCDALNRIGSDFSKKWREIAHFIYRNEGVEYHYDNANQITGVTWKIDGTDRPKNGCLNPYSAKSIDEDIATFLEPLGYAGSPEMIKEHLPIPEKVNIDNLFPLYFADTTDHRYQKKLDLLKEYNFLTKEEHEKLSENLGSLNYLLKK